MKIAKETSFIIIVGLYLLAYLLEAVVQPLAIDIATPYEYLKPEYLGQYPFTTASIVIRALAFLFTPLWLLSFLKRAYIGKGAALLVVGALMQLYSLQEVLTGTTLVPLEYSIALALAGALTLIPAVIFLITGMFTGAAEKITGKSEIKEGSLEEVKD